MGMRIRFGNVAVRLGAGGGRAGPNGRSPGRRARGRPGLWALILGAAGLIASAGAGAAVSGAAATEQPGIALTIETGATIDIARIAEVIPDATVADGVATWVRSFQTLSPNSTSCDSKKPSFFEAGIDVDVRFSIGANGVLHAQTVGGDKESHLGAFSSRNRWSASGLGSAENYSDFAGNPLNVSVYGEAKNANNADAAHGNRLADWLHGYYAQVSNGGLASTGPANRYELYNRPHRLRNTFDEPVSVIRTILRTEQMDYGHYPAAQRPIDTHFNRLWSPIGNSPNRDADLARSLDLAYRGATGGLVSISSVSDNRNWGRVVVSGLAGASTWSDSDGSRWSAGCNAGTGECTIGNNNCTGAMMTVKGSYPTRVSMQARSVWSWVQTVTEVAVFGYIEPSNFSESPSPGDDGNPAPLHYVIPSDAGTGPEIALRLAGVETARHGFGWGDKAYRRVLPATFVGDGSDRLLHVQGYDLDNADELTVFLNDNPLGTLSQTGSDKLGRQALWWLPAAIQRTGTNRIEIRQKTDGETWGVTRLGLYAPGAAFGNLAGVTGGDTAHGAGFELHLPWAKAGYLLGLAGYDNDGPDGGGAEIRVLLNGRNLADLPKGPDMGWSRSYRLAIPGDRLRSGDNLLFVSDRLGAAEAWGLRPLGLGAFGGALGEMPSIPKAQRLTDRVDLLIPSVETASILELRCYDANDASEIARELDGAGAGNCRATADNAWGTIERIALAGGSSHVLTLDNRLNPPAQDPWGVRLVAWSMDSDGDSVGDRADNCLRVANPDQVNLDGDPWGDACDSDLDGDGWANAQDAFPMDKAEWLDTDGDKLGNNADPDDDGDGFADLDDPSPLDSARVPAAAIGTYRPAGRTFVLDVDGDLQQGEGDSTGGPLADKGTDLVLVGDWNGDGHDELGFYRPSTRVFHLDLDGSGGWSDTEPKSRPFGAAGDRPVIGDWDGDGADEIGAYSPSQRTFTLDLDGSRGPSAGDLTTAPFLSAPGLPVAGDWDGDGADEIGVYRPETGRFYLDRNGDRAWQGRSGDRTTATFGLPGDLPAVGDWNGDARDEIGVYDPTERRFYLDLDGTGAWGEGDAQSESFGAKGDAPISGRW